MLDFSLLHSTISWWKVANMIYVISSWFYLTSTLSQFTSFMLALMLNISIFIHYIMKKLSSIWDHLMRGCMGQFPYIQTWKRFHILWSFLGYICQLLDLTNQKSCVGNMRLFYSNDEQKEDIFVIIWQIQNINQYKI